MWLQRTRDVQRRSTARRWRQRRRHTLIHIRQTTLHVGFYREIVKCVRKRGRRAIKWVGSSRRQQIKTAPTNAKSSRYLFFFLSGRLFLFYESALTHGHTVLARNSTEKANTYRTLTSPSKYIRIYWAHFMNDVVSSPVCAPSRSRLFTYLFRSRNAFKAKSVRLNFAIIIITWLNL